MPAKRRDGPPVQRQGRNGAPIDAPYGPTEEFRLEDTSMKIGRLAGLCWPCLVFCPLIVSWSVADAAIFKCVDKDGNDE
jgi:hypothetical protein